MSKVDFLNAEIIYNSSRWEVFLSGGLVLYIWIYLNKAANLSGQWGPPLYYQKVIRLYARLIFQDTYNDDDMKILHNSDGKL